jgi:hypothetical protein
MLASIVVSNEGDAIQSPHHRRKKRSSAVAGNLAKEMQQQDGIGMSTMIIFALSKYLMICIDDPSASTGKAMDTTITLHENTTVTLLQSHSSSPQLPELVFSSANPLSLPDTWKLRSSTTVNTEKTDDATAVLNSTELPFQTKDPIEPEQIRVHTVQAPSAATAELLGDIAFHDHLMPKTTSIIRPSHSDISVVSKGQIQHQVRSSLPERRRRRRAAMDIALRLWADG